MGVLFFNLRYKQKRSRFYIKTVKGDRFSVLWKYVTILSDNFVNPYSLWQPQRLSKWIYVKF